MNDQLHLKTVLLGVAILFAFAYTGGVFIARERLSDLRSELQQQITEQQKLLLTIANTTAHNGADEITQRIIKDCAHEDRTQFDVLLGRLNSGLSNEELSTLERLFGRCGSFYAERKSVIVARFEREVEIYINYISQLEQIGSINENELQVDLWKQLVADEKMQSEKFSSLVEHQDKIIAALLSGKSATSPEIKEILDEVKRVQQSLTEASISAGEKRRVLDAG